MGVLWFFEPAPDRRDQREAADEALRAETAVRAQSAGQFFDAAAVWTGEIAGDPRVQLALAGQAAPAKHFFEGALQRNCDRILGVRLLDASGGTMLEVGTRRERLAAVLGFDPPWKSPTNQQFWFSSFEPGAERGWLFEVAARAAGTDGGTRGWVLATFDGYRALATPAAASGNEGRFGLLLADGRWSVADAKQQTLLGRSAWNNEGVAEWSRGGEAGRLCVSPLATMETLPGSAVRSAPYRFAALAPPTAVAAAPVASRLLSFGTALFLVCAAVATWAGIRLSTRLTGLRRRLDALHQQRTGHPVGDETTGNELRALEATVSALESDAPAASRRLRGRISELEREVQQLHHRSETQDEFLSFLCHELRTPLAAIRSFSELIRGTPDLEPAERQEFLEIIEAESQRVTLLATDLLDVTRIDSGAMPWRDRWVDPKVTGNIVVRTMQILARRKRVHLLFQHDPDLDSLCVDPHRLQQVLINLVSNALRFTPEAGQVTVRISNSTLRGRPAVSFAVLDTGPGIPAEMLARVFERFVQAPDRHHSARGAGLGLAIAQRIVQQYEGEISAENLPTSGARVHFCLPVGEKPELDDEGEESIDTSPWSSEPALPLPDPALSPSP